MSMENQLIQIANIRHASGEVICDIQKLKVKFYKVDYTAGTTQVEKEKAPTRSFFL